MEQNVTPPVEPQKNKYIPLLIVTIVLTLIAGIGTATFYFITRSLATKEAYKPSRPVPPTVQPTIEPTQNTVLVPWEFTGSAWQAKATPPACPQPLQMTSPVDISLVSGILYPGQERGNDYKPHGGFRFDGKNSEEINVTAPMDGFLVRASRYIEQDDVQYLLEFINSCGIMYRFDHISALSPKFESLYEILPAAQQGDSRTTNIDPPIAVEQGDEIATAVGFKTSENISVDFGVYDLRQPNTISQNETWATEHENIKELAYFGICWLDLLSKEDADTLRGLPKASTEGSESDYCM